MSAPGVGGGGGAQSPGAPPRSASISSVAGNMLAPSQPPSAPPPMVSNVGQAAGPPQSMSQQNLNQIVIDYLAKKGYHRTEATLRAESAAHLDPQAQSPNGTPLGVPKTYTEAFDKLKNWVDDALDVYKSELRRLLWPIFVHAFLIQIAAGKMDEGRKFFDQFKNLFIQEHGEDLRTFQSISLVEHVQDNRLAKLYRDNKYRLTMTEPAFNHFMQYLERQPGETARLIIPVVEGNLNIKLASRASDDRYSLSAMLARSKEVQDMPDEDEGIPGHHPGSAYTGDKPGLDGVLAKVKIGKMPMETELEGDVRAELEELDERQPPGPGEDSLVKTHEMVNIKQEEDEEGPSRADIPFPPSTARDVAMEVVKIRENRDRFKIEKDARTGGVAASMSVCMFTLHNSCDAVTCMDFSGDNKLVAAGTSKSYIKIWSIDGKPIPSEDPNITPSDTQRLYGHSGAVYAVSFSPSLEGTQESESISPTRPHFLLSSSADGTVIMWSLDTFQQVVIYKGHHGPVWDFSWGPFGHYFVTGGHDKTARLWMTNQTRHVRIFAGHEDGVDVVAFHPNSAYVFTASSDKTVRMWAVSNGAAVRMFTGHPSMITSLACSRDGKQLASGDDSGNILIWDLATGRLSKRLKGHGKGGIWSLAFTVESTVLISGGADATVRVWDVHPAAKPYTNQPNATSTAGTANADAAKEGTVAGAGSTNAATSSATGVGTMAPSALGGTGKRRKDDVVSWEQISAFPTKKTPIYKVKITGMNLAIAGGCAMP